MDAVFFWTLFLGNRCARRACFTSEILSSRARGCIGAHMYLKTDGIVLRETEYKDNDKLLTILTRENGQVTAKIRGVKSRTSKLRAGCQLLTFSEIHFA